MAALDAKHNVNNQSSLYDVPQLTTAEPLAVAAFGGKEVCLFSILLNSNNGEDGKSPSVMLRLLASNLVCKDWIMDIR